MSYFNTAQLKRRRHTNRTILIVIAGVLGVLCVWVLSRSVFRKQAEGIPVISGDVVYNTLTPKRTLVRKITELQTTLNAYNAELVTAKLLADENAQLKAELGRPGATKGTLAHVITLPNRSFYDTFTIDGGAAIGIKENQIAYAFGGIALGVISSVQDHSATVTLFSASGRTTSGTATGSNVAVTLIGRGGGEYEVRIPREVQFTVGGLIAYQSTESTVLAEIERIVTDPRDPFQRLIAKAPVNLQALKWVIVR